VRRSGTVPFVVTSTPPAGAATDYDATAAAATNGPQTRARRLRAGVYFGLRGYVGARQTPRLQLRHELFLFLGQKSADKSIVLNGTLPMTDV